MLPSKETYLILLLLFSLQLYGQETFTSQPQQRGEQALVMYISGGAGYYPSYKGALSYLQPRMNNINPVSSIRLMWHPDHLLKVGLETGYITFLSYSIEDTAGNKGKVVLRAIPVLLEWTMAITRRINIFAGSGVYFTQTKLDYAGVSTSGKISVGWMAAASYIQPVSKNMGLGVEVKWLDAAESRDGSVCLQLQWVWRFLKW
jgi:hypothetical protein